MLPRCALCLRSNVCCCSHETASRARPLTLASIPIHADVPERRPRHARLAQLFSLRRLARAARSLRAEVVLAAHSTRGFRVAPRRLAAPPPAAEAADSVASLPPLVQQIAWSSSSSSRLAAATWCAETPCRTREAPSPSERPGSSGFTGGIVHVEKIKPSFTNRSPHPENKTRK